MQCVADALEVATQQHAWCRRRQGCCECLVEQQIVELRVDLLLLLRISLSTGGARQAGVAIARESRVVASWIERLAEDDRIWMELSAGIGDGIGIACVKQVYLTSSLVNSRPEWNWTPFLRFNLSCL
jgi:hypothetical protein